MPVGEIGYRLRQALLKARLRRGWRPWPEVTSLAGMADLGLGREEPASGPWEQVLRDAMTAPGRHALLGLPARDLGDPPEWFTDPVTGGAWHSSQVAPSIDYRHQTRLGEVKYIWEVARMPWLLPRALAARALRHVGLADLVVRDINDFVRRNPPITGIHWTSGIEFAWRAVTWAFALDLVRGLSTPCPDELGAIATHLGAGAELCLRLESRFSSANNHLIAEGACLETVALAFPSLERAAVWREAGRRILDEEIPRQILPDGGGCEYCPAYLLEILEWALVVARLRQAAGEGIPPSWRERFAQSARYLASLCGDEESLPSIGDSDDANLFPIPGETSSMRVEHVIAALRSWSDGDGSQHPGILVRLLGNQAAAPTPARARPDARRSFAPSVELFPHAGHAVLRAGPLRAILECGPHGLAPLYAHAHSDAGSLLLDWAGAPVLVDPGTYCYHGERAWRDWFRSAAAHNLVQLEGREQARILGPFMWDHVPRLASVRAGPIGVPSAIAHHSAFDPWHVERSVTLIGADRLRVEDRIEWTARGPAPRQPLASVRWQFAPGSLSANAEGQTCIWTAPQGVVAELEWRWTDAESVSPPNTSKRPAPGTPEWNQSVAEGDECRVLSAAPGAPLAPNPSKAWISPGFSARLPAPALILSGPWPEGRILVTEIKLTGQRRRPSRNESTAGAAA